MRNLEIVGKIGKFFAVVGAIFTVFMAVDTYFLLAIVSPSAPGEYFLFYTLQSVMPYLFVAVLSIVLAAVCWGVVKENQEGQTPEETEVPSETAPTETA